MCSAVNASVIEGGHRSWQMVKYFTGAPLNEKSPQPFVPLPRNEGAKVEPDASLKMNGLSQAEYEYFFWQRLDTTSTPLSGNVWKDLQKHSFSVKQIQEVGCDDTNDAFFKQMLKSIDKAFKDLDQFNADDLYRDWEGGIEIVNQRLALICDLVKDLVQKKMPMKQKWNELTGPRKKKYDPPKKNEKRSSSMVSDMNFDDLVKLMVSDMKTQDICLTLSDC